MHIQFWGVRGSIPSPLPAAAIQAKIVNALLAAPPNLDRRDRAAVEAYVASLPPLARGTAGGNTACVEVRSGNTLIVLDAGSGLRELGLELMRGPCGRGQGLIHVCLSHPHWDHIQGFPFFTPAFIPGNRIIFYSVHDLQQALTDQQRFLTFPIPLEYMRATREFIRITEGQSFIIDDVHISTLRNPHPGDAYSFRIADRHSTFVYASDAEYNDLSSVALQPRIDFFRNADALVFDVQYTLKEAWQKVDWGHSSAMIGVDLARAAGVRRLLLFHHDPTYIDPQLELMRQTAVDYQAQDETRPSCEILLAYEGLFLDLTPPGSIDLLPLDDGSHVIMATSVFDTQTIRQIVEQLDANEGDVFVDLTHINTLNTADLKALVALVRTHRDQPLVLICPATAIQQIIRLSGYADFFAIYPSVEAAQASIHLRAALNLPGYLLKKLHSQSNKCWVMLYYACSCYLNDRSYLIH